MEIFKLFGSIFVDSSAAEKSISQSSKSALSFAEKLGNGIKTAAKWGAAIAGAAAVGVGSMFKFAESTAASLDNVDKMSQRLGITRQSFQELDFILSQSGVDINSFQTGMKSLLANMDKVSEGNETATSNFEKLGIAVQNADGSLRSQDEVLWETISAFQGMEDSAEKSRLAQELFGKQGQEILPLLNSEAGSMEDLKQKANELGLVMSDEVIDAGVKLTDTIDQTKRSFKAIVTSIGGDVIPIVQKGLEKFLAWLPALKNIVSQMKDKMKPVLVAVGTAIKDVALKAGEFIEKVIEWAKEHDVAEKATQALSKAIDALKTALNIAKNTINTVVSAIKSMAEWVEKNKTAIGLMAIAVGTLTTAIIAYNAAQAIANAGGIAAVASHVAQTAAETAHAAATAVATAATTAFGAATAFLTSPITAVIAAIGALVAGIYLLAKNWDDVKEAASICWNAIVGVFAGAGKWFNDNVVTPIKNFFGGLWKSISDTLKNNSLFQAGRDLFNSFFNGIKSVWNTIEGWVNEKVNWIRNKLNIGQFTASISSSSVASKITASQPTSSSHTSTKKHAKGGLVTKETNIDDIPDDVVGEAGPEIVIPLERNTEWIDTVATGILSRLGANQNSSSRAEELLEQMVSVMLTYMPRMAEGLNIDGKKASKAMAPYMDTELGKIAVSNARGVIA